MKPSCTFCVGHSDVIAQGGASASIDTFTVLLQELDDEQLKDGMEWTTTPNLYGLRSKHSDLSLHQAEVIDLPPEYEVPWTNLLQSRRTDAAKLH